MHSGLEFKSMYIHHIPNNNISYEILTKGGNVINFFSNKNLSSKYPHYNIFRIVPQWKKYTNFTIDGIERKKNETNCVVHMELYLFLGRWTKFISWLYVSSGETGDVRLAYFIDAF